MIGSKTCLLETSIYTAFSNDILQRVSATNQGLQSKKLDLNVAVASLASLKDFVVSRHDSFDSYERQGKQKSHSAEYIHTQKRHHNTRLNPLDYGEAEQALISPSENYRAENFIPVIDQFIASLDQCLHVYELLQSIDKTIL